MTARALLLALLLALTGCADGSGGARLVHIRTTPLGRIDTYRMADGAVRRLYVPAPTAYEPAPARWLQPWEYATE